MIIWNRIPLIYKDISDPIIHLCKAFIASHFWLPTIRSDRAKLMEI